MRVEFEAVFHTATVWGYRLRGLFCGQGNIPIERQVDLPETAPGGETTLELAFTQSEPPIHVQIDVLRPTSFSAYLFDWRP